METFSPLLALCTGNSPVSGEFPAQRPVTRSFDVFFDLHLIKLLNKHSRGWWFETLSCTLWRHRNGKRMFCQNVLARLQWQEVSCNSFHTMSEIFKWCFQKQPLDCAFHNPFTFNPYYRCTLETVYGPLYYKSNMLSSIAKWLIAFWMIENENF